MKSLATIVSKTTIKLYVLTGMLIYLGITNQLVAQNLINNIRSPHPNLGNINNNIIQFTLIDNGPNNNISQLAKSINVAGIKKKASSPVKKNKVIPKPINKQVVTPYNPKPVIKSKKPLPLPTKKNQNVILPSTKPILVIQQLINAPVVNEVSNLATNAKQEVAIIENVIVAQVPVKSNNQLIVKPNDRKVDVSSGSFSGSKKATHHFYASKRKSINHFRYSANKKIAKLFARTKKNKIDPARCFVWS